MNKPAGLLVFAVASSFGLLISAENPAEPQPPSNPSEEVNQEQPLTYTRPAEAPLPRVGLVSVKEKPISQNIENQLPHTDYVMMPGIAPAPQGQPLSLQDAIAYMLKHQIALQISQLNIVVQEGHVRNAAGPFDYYFTAAETYTDERNVLNGNLNNSGNGNENIIAIAATKTNRVGTTFAAAALADKVNDPYNVPPTSNNGSISFIITQPLLRGFLNGIDWMNEIAAHYELYATYFDNFQTVSQNLLNVVNSYWAAVAAKKVLEIQEEGVKRLDDLAYKIEQLIDNNELSGDQMHQVEQQIITNEQNLITSEQLLYSSIEQLKLAMGDFSLCDPTDDPYDLTDKFPLPPFDPQEFEKQFEDYIFYSLEHSYNIIASTLRQREAYYFLKGARNETLPALNILGGVTDLDLVIGEDGKPVLSSLRMKKPQTNWTIGVTLAFPLYNDTAIGLYVEKKAEYIQSLLATQLLEQNAIASLRQALAQQITLALQLKESDANVRVSRILYDEGVIKLQSGLLSLFDLLIFESSLTSALVNRATIRMLYMQNIAEIRFLTATMFYQSEDGLIHVLDATTLPAMQMDRSNAPLNRKLSQRAEERARQRAERKEQRLRRKNSCSCLQ